MSGESGAAKNPFAKKAAAAPNPFAKQAVAKPLDSIKSTSFFERVDNIELSGAPKGSFGMYSMLVEDKLMSTIMTASVKPKAKPKPKDVGGKQGTLLGMKKVMPPPRAIERDSYASTETEGDYDETLGDETPSGILGESHVSTDERAG